SLPLFWQPASVSASVTAKAPQRARFPRFMIRRCKTAVYRFIMNAMVSRRQFVAAALAASAQARALQTIGVQLYTVRGVLPAKPAETLHAIESIGYKEVEATYANLDQVAPAIAATTLKPVSIHLDMALFAQGKDDELARAIDTVKQRGFLFAVFPYILPAER